MRTQTESTEGNKVKLTVEVDDEEFEKALDATFRKLAREVRVPGFRPGKAPRKLLEARMGTEAVRREAIQDALPDLYAEALRQSDVDPIAPPEIDITSGKESGPLAFNALVEVRPHVSIVGYQGLQVTVPCLEVTDEEIDAQVDRLRGQFGELVVVNRPARDGDHVTIDIKGYRHSETLEGLTADDYVYEVGSASVAPKLDEQLSGSSVGDIFKFNDTVNGEDVSFQVLVKEVKEKVLPPVTDEWAADASEFGTVSELRDDLHSRIGAVKRLQTQLALREGAMEALCELVADPPPESLVDEEVRRRLHNLMHGLESDGATLDQYLEANSLDQQRLLDRLRADADKVVRADLALRALSDAESIEVSDHDLDTEIGQMAERVDKTPAQVRRQLERNGRLGEVRSDMRSSKALTWLLDNVELVDAEGKPVERAQLRPPDEADGDAAEPVSPKTVETEA